MGYGLFVCLGRCSGVPAYGLRGHLRAFCLVFDKFRDDDLQVDLLGQ